MSNRKPMLNSKVYDTLKWTVQIALPAFAAMYYGLSEIWDLPNTVQVVGTITAVTTFLGVILGVSSYHYKQSGAKYDGTMRVYEGEDTDTYSLELDDDPTNLAKMKELVFKVEDLLSKRR